MRKEPFDPDRLLDGIVDHLRQQPVPPLPEHVFPESVKSPPRTKQHPFAAMRRLMMQRPVQISAAIVFVVAGALILHMVPLGDVATVAMADVVEALNTKKSIMFHVFDYHGDDDPFVTKVMYLGMDRFRTETSGGDVRIVNIKEAKMMYVSHDKRTALIESFEESRELSAQMLDLITILRNIQDKATRRFGERVMKNALHGSETKVIDFAVPLDGREFTLTVDTETKLPIRMEFATVKLAGTNKSFREVYTDFVFDAVLDESLFAINPPADYAVERRVLPKPDSKRGDASLVVSPTTGIGPVKFGATKEEIFEALGEPDWSKTRDFVMPIQTPKDKEAKRSSSTELHYGSRGFTLNLNDQDGLLSIRCFNRQSMGPLVGNFQGQTAEGIRLGATLHQVLKAHGEPDGTLGDDDSATLMYVNRGWQFTFRKGKLASIRVSRPSPVPVTLEKQKDGTLRMKWKKK